MRPRVSAFTLLLCTTASMLVGCRFRDPSVDMLHGELRWMEDQLYMLEAELEDTCVELARCQSECDQCMVVDDVVLQPQSNAKSSATRRKRPLTERERAKIIPEIIEPPTSDAPRSTIRRGGPIFAAPSHEEMPVETFESPAIEIRGDATLDAEVNPIADPVPSTPDRSPPRSPREQSNERSSSGQNELPSPPDAPSASQSLPDSDADLDSTSLPGRHRLSRIRLQSHVDSEPIEESRQADAKKSEPVIDAHITHIVAKQMPMSRGDAAGFAMVVQPRNADGNYVALPASVSVVVLDGNQQGEQARVARWDFTAEDTAALLNPDGETKATERGIPLQLTWPKSTPKSDDLRIYVRYVTVDGRKLESQLRLGEPTGNETSPWIVADSTIAVRNPAAVPPSFQGGSSGWTVVEHQESVPSAASRESSSRDDDPGPPEPARFDTSILESNAKPAAENAKPTTEQWRPFR